MFCQNRQGRTAVCELTVPFPVIACCHKRCHECFLSGVVQRLQVPSSKEHAAWLVRDAETTPGPEAAVAQGTTGAGADPGHHSINDDRIRWSSPGPGNPLPLSMTATESTVSICPVRWFRTNVPVTYRLMVWTFLMFASLRS